MLNEDNLKSLDINSCMPSPKGNAQVLIRQILLQLKLKSHTAFSHWNYVCVYATQWSS